MKKGIFLVLVVLILLSITKPSEESFNNYIQSELVSKKNDDVLTKIVKGVTKIQSELSTDYYDKIFYSISETTMGNEKHKFLGIFGFWFEIN